MNCSNEYEFRIFGLRRSGNHMLVASIMSCFDKNEVYYFNDVSNPLSILNLNRTPRKYYHEGDTHYFNLLSSKLVNKEMYINFQKIQFKKCIIQTYEDQDLEIIDKINMQSIGQSKYKYNILILRDPFNLFASRMKHLEKFHTNYLSINNKIVKLWKQYAREFLDETNILGEIKIVINYNKFIIDKEYQKEILNKLNLPFEKFNCNTILNFGNGSSFSGIKKIEDKNIYNNRWKHYINNPKFKYILQDKELNELSNRIFGNIIYEI